jgi:hypothetical protein
MLDPGIPPFLLDPAVDEDVHTTRMPSRNPIEDVEDQEGPTPEAPGCGQWEDVAVLEPTEITRLH